ncbi:hypothetical protein [Flavobacterium reichenbachii]|uniref:Lipoprotein n=1 Tax=Flavobacterium reichenbachii TaxID=362418 RepID=A0A085ZT00_9FLAO|nr:hypothetical protein [Flavobacterium reichenbachii]KFF07564.1 hypothetical protein IW19_19555 [Flavobacterium reichenbachii]OXB14207.1 hypothetical protein B0A68_13365 [Flavobacterium reichenbachii]
MILYKLTTAFTAILLITACSNKPKEQRIKKEETKNTAGLSQVKDEESIEGLYSSKECDITLEIRKEKNGFTYFLKTTARKVNGKAVFTKESSGERNLLLDGIQWDEYEGDISNQEDSDSIASKEIEIPTGISAGYVKDTLTIQNYGNAMNYYTKLSECGLKYIQLIKND